MRLCFEVADIESVAKHLAERGVEFVGPVSPYETAPGVKPSGVEAKFLCVRDPDGTVIEYAQFAQDALDVLQPIAGAISLVRCIAGAMRFINIAPLPATALASRRTTV